MKKSLLIIITALALISCSKNSNNTSQFQGTWHGTYTGADDNGSFSVTVDINGIAQGSVSSNVFVNETFQLVGTVDDQGTITITFGIATSGGTFTGLLKGVNGSGTWENKMTNPTFTGTWTAHKN